MVAGGRGPRGAIGVAGNMTPVTNIRRLSSRRLCGTLWLLAVLPPAQADDAPVATAGPVLLRIVSPLRILFYQLSPERATTLPHGVWDLGLELSESNVIHIRNLPATKFDAEIDLEMTRLHVGAHVGLGTGSR